jgi:uncharacterized membrane protein
MGLALLIFELGNARLPAQLRVLLAPTLVAALFAVVTEQPDGLVKYPALAVWITFLGGCAACWLPAARFFFLPPADATEEERTSLRDVLLATGAIFAGVLLWMQLPEAAVSASWVLLALGLWFAGERLRWTALRGTALAVAGCLVCRLLIWDVWAVLKWHDVPQRLVSAPFAIAALYLLHVRCQRTEAEEWERFLGRVVFWGVFPVLMLLAWSQTDGNGVAVPFAAFALIFQAVTLRFNHTDARVQSWLAAFAAFAWAIGDDLGPRHLSIAIATAALFYGTQLIARRAQQKYAPIYFSLLGTLLVGALLYNQVSGAMLTVAWTIQGLGLVVFGFPLRDRVLRLQGLAMLLCVVLPKLLAHDLLRLETLYRILSYFAVGLVLMVISAIYSRFREQVKKLL